MYYIQQLKIIQEKGRIILKPVPNNRQGWGDAFSEMHDKKEDTLLMPDQIRTFDNKRLIKRIGELPSDKIQKTMDNIRICLDLD